MALRALSVMIFVVFVLFTISVEAGYRKPPFNGSIFGKRGTTNAIGKKKKISLDILNKASRK